MTFWTVVVLIFVTLNTLYSIARFLKNKAINTWLLIKLLVLPGIFPYGLFVYGFIYQFPAFYTLLAWNPTLWFFAMFILVIVVMMISNLTLAIIFNEHAVDVTKEDVKRDIANSHNRLGEAVKTALAISISAALSEESIFRFIMFFACLTLLEAWGAVFGLVLINTIATLPLWLSLGVGAMIPAPAFAALFIINVVYALAHLMGADGKFHPWFHKVIYTWFFGWVVIMALVQFGFVGAILVHFLMDFILMIPLVKRDFDQVAEAYWNSKYGPK